MYLFFHHGARDCGSFFRNYTNYCIGPCSPTLSHLIGYIHVNAPVRQKYLEVNSSRQMRHLPSPGMLRLCS